MLATDRKGTPMTDQVDPAAAIRAMVDQWVSLSTALSNRAAGEPPTRFDLGAVSTQFLGAVNLPTRAEVLAIGAAIAAVDARLARIEAMLGPNDADARSARSTSRSTTMADLSQIKEHMNVIGADGVHVGTVDGVEGRRIKLTKHSSSHTDHHHFISGGLVAGVEGNDVRLSANGDVAVTFEEEA
jgi:hypothetical protein